jgi:cytochrome c-type biogenesis protein CcmH
MLFWTIAAIMLLLALAALLPTLLRKSEKAQSDTKAHNVIIAKERLDELEAELAAGTISQEIFEQTRNELEQGLLEDVGEEQVKVPRSSVLVDRFGLILIFLLVPALTIGTYFALGSPEHVNVKGPGVQDPHAGGGQPASMEQLVAKLEKKVAANPGDAEGLFMLGRVYSSLGRFDEAAKVLERLRPLVDDHPAVLVALADALSMQNGGRVSGKPYELVKQVLDKEPEDVTALWIAGKGAMEQADYQNAIYYWRQAEAGLGDEPEMLAEMQRLIAQLLQSAKKAGAALDDPGPTVAAATSPGIQLSVTLSPELRDKLTGNEQLFIFAKAVAGPPMPLAAIKRSAGELPLALVLDDSAMLQGGKLTDHEQLKIAARITSGGQPVAKSGDLQSTEIIFKPGTGQSVELVIDQVVP